jgi:hypothetical protein
MMAQQSNKPVQQIRLGGVKASIWRHENGDFIRHSVTLSRSYQRDGEWHETQSFGRDDLPRLMKCADLVYDWIFDQARTSHPRGADQTATVEAQA